MHSNFKRHRFIHSVGQTDKQVNSPLISFTLYDPDGVTPMKLPKNTHVKLVYEHDVIAKYPPIGTIRRDLKEDELMSAVIGSSLCSYLLLEDDVSFWAWDDQGCRVASTNETHTICQCDHLTGFATLMDFHNYTVRIF